MEAQQAVANAEDDAHERQVARLASQQHAALASVARVRDFATAMAAESPKPGPGGFIAESIIEVLDQQQAGLACGASVGMRGGGDR